MKILAFTLCWIVYAVSYLCRTNLAITLPSMSRELGFSLTEGGLLGLGFFWAYAAGQLVNGYIGDKIEPRPMIAIGLGLSGVINILAGSIEGFLQGAVLWSINGFALSMLWGPAVKIIAALYESAEAERKAIVLSYSMIAGYIVSWGLIGRIISMADWRWAFRLPGISALLVCLVWIVCTRRLAIGIQHRSHTGEGAARRSIAERLPLWFILIAAACLFQGIAKDGISLWGPTILKSAAGLNQTQLSSISLLIPVLTATGVFISGMVNKRFQGRVGLSVGILMLASAVTSASLAFLLKLDALVVAITLGILLALILGANTLMLGVVPLAFRSLGLVSWAAGFLDFASYIGSAISGVITAQIALRSGWTSVCLFWAVTSFVSAIIALISARRLITNDYISGDNA